jgi:hypothetical protein
MLAVPALLLAIVCHAQQPPQPPRTMEVKSDFDPATLVPFTKGVPYLGKYETGLYPGAKNEMPFAHRRAGERIAATIRPLDTDGKPDDRNGRILALVFGHSNCSMYFRALEQELRQRAKELHPRFEMLNAAVGGQQLPEISQLQGRVWDRATQLLDRPGYSAQQVQVLFLHTTYHGASNRAGRPAVFPERMQEMRRDLAKVLGHCRKCYPNLRIAYLTADGFRHFTGFEPHVWQEAFGIKWLVESQIRGEAGTAFEGAQRKLPWLCWGPYIWDNTWGRRMFTDGVHPGREAQAIFVEKYWNHLRADSVAKPWLMRGR